ncbi:phage tail sheath protein FI [Catenuloplanes nepalensis]|uniref:Phage tail sheath protein FI n=1 Tax=Catenuloplanes nepalensis TaxID=587533 RepID=A0ABT9MP75_9ACTN|nr:phage tail sheath C-terminal domain-containing protein [Catenuloplanes nepalensis]MDP9793198.1 phage tail sheath protein FI [Catenuloplanes nepalensis]
MPEYLSPGVYVEEIDAGPRPIAGVGTSTAGFVGVTARGPAAGKPQLVTTFLEFQRTFGGYLPAPDAESAARWAGDADEGGRWWTFPHSVKGFFDNGGQRLYVKRVVSAGAVAATRRLGLGLVTEVVRDAARDATEVSVRHLLGFAGVGTPIEVVTLGLNENGEPAEVVQATTIAGYDAAASRLTLADPLPDGLRASRGDFIRAAGAGETHALTVEAVSPGAWGQNVQVRARPVVAASLPLLADPGEGAAFTTRLLADAGSATNTAEVDGAGLDPPDGPLWVVIGGARYEVTASRAAGQNDGPVTLTFAGEHPDFAAGTVVRRIRRATADDRPSVGAAGAGRLYPGAIVQADNGTRPVVRTVRTIGPDTLTFDPPLTGPLFEGDRLVLIEGEVAVRAVDPVSGEVTEETFPNLRLDGDERLGLASVLASRSALVRATTGADGLVRVPTADGDSLLLASTGGWVPLSGGDDGLATLSPADFAGVDGGSGARTGVVALEDVDEIAIVAVPGIWAGSVQSALITHCEFLKDRFAILDPRDGLSIEGVQEFREPFDTSYAALYYPWLVAPDPVTGGDVELPPSGHLAGIYARVDVERGVHKAPANAIVRGIRLRDGLAQDVTRRHQDLLNPRGINALRFFPGQGHRVWGARTLSADPAWRYINVRRLFLFIEESIDEGTQWVVFEPNAEPLWALVKQTVENFLGTVWRSGALAGTTQDEAFFVACDRTTMTEDDILNGRLVCVVGVAPVRPAEFVIFRIHQQTRESQLAA